MFNITGEYVFDIHIPTMFNDYNIRVTNHNMLVSTGISFILNKLTDTDTTGLIGYIQVGSGTSEATLEDTELEHPTKTFHYNPANISIVNNTLRIKENITGEELDNTTEIGVYTTTDVLISRSVHDQYSIPHSALIKLTYTYTLTNIEVEKQGSNDIDD